MINTELGVGIDNTKEYLNHTPGIFSKQEGFLYESSYVDTPQQNRIAKRKNRHLLNVTHSLLFQSYVPTRFWVETVLTATHLINHMPSRTFGNKSRIHQLSKFYSKIPITNNFPPKVFSCVAFFHIHKQLRSELDPRAIQCTFIG